MCVPYWWCTKHAQLIMGTWPIYKKHFLQLILTKKPLSFDKIYPRDFYFFPFFSICTCEILDAVIFKVPSQTWKGPIKFIPMKIYPTALLPKHLSLYYSEVCNLCYTIPLRIFCSAIFRIYDRVRVCNDCLMAYILHIRVPWSFLVRKIHTSFCWV